MVGQIYATATMYVRAAIITVNHNAYSDVTRIFKCRGKNDNVCTQGKISSIFQLEATSPFSEQRFLYKYCCWLVSLSDQTPITVYGFAFVKKPNFVL